MTTIAFGMAAFFFVITVGILAEKKGKMKYRILMATPFGILALVFAKGFITLAMM